MRSHRNPRITARSTPRATSKPGSPPAILLRFLVAPSLLLLLALLLYPLQAADPLFDSSSNPRLQVERDSAFKIKFKPSSSSATPAVSDERNETLRIQLQGASVPRTNSLPAEQSPSGVLEIPDTAPATTPAPEAPSSGTAQELSGITLLPPEGPIPPLPARPPTTFQPPTTTTAPLPPELVIEADEEPGTEIFPTTLSTLLQDAAGEGVDNPILECRSVSCEETIRQLRPTAISSISLDITPSFNPNLSAPPPRLQEDVRNWTDRQGMAIATGQLADLKFGRVVIQLEDGSQQVFPIDQLSDNDRCYVSDTWGFPLDCQLVHDHSGGRDFTPITLSWTASALCKRPGFFEDELLERYGFTAGPWIQPFRSGAHFLVDMAIIPYRAGIQPHNECIYTLGFFRPGSPAPTIRPGFPISVKGGLWQAGVLTGGFYMLP